MGKLFGVLAGVGAGALIMYLLDPVGGGRRRALIKDKAVGLSSDLTEAVGAKARDLTNRAQGLVHEGRSLLTNSSSQQSMEADTRA